MLPCYLHFDVYYSKYQETFLYKRVKSIYAIKYMEIFTSNMYTADVNVKYKNRTNNLRKSLAIGK